MKKQFIKHIQQRINLLFAVVFTSISTFVSATPTNDSPCNAINLNVDVFCNSATYSNLGANGNSGIASPSCGNFAGGDVWFNVTVPACGGINIITAAGTMTDGAMAIYSGSCNSLSLIDCNDDGTSGLMPELNASGLTPGSTVWIRVWSVMNSSNGTFDICVTEAPTNRAPTFPTVTNTCGTYFCPTAAPFPTQSGIASMGGGGVFGCLGSTPNPIWTIFQATVSTPITMGANSSNGADIDYIVWGPFASPAVACTGYSAANIISCSYSTAGSNSWTFTPVAGQYYILLVTNYSQQTGITVAMPISPAGSISCGCTTTPSSNGPVCAGNALTLSTTSVTGAITYNWTGPNGFAASGLNTSVAVTTPASAGTYSVSVTTAGNTCTSTLAVVVNPLPAVTNIPAPQFICDGASAVFNPSITPAAGATYSWTASSPSGLVWGFPASGTNLTPINFVLHNPGTTPAVVTFVVTPIGAAPTLCHGTPINYVVTVNPKPTISNPPPMAFICSGTSASYTPVSGLAGTTFLYTATASSPSITGFTAAGASNINDVITNSGTAAGTVTYVVTPYGGAPTLCAGTQVNFVVNVIPAPSPANAGPDQSLCANSGALAATLPSVGAGTWTALSSTGIISNISQENSPITGLNNGSNSFQWVVTNAPCPASVDTVIIIVDDTPTITNAVLTQTICAGTATSISPTASVANCTFDWTASSSSANITGFTAAGNNTSGFTISDLLTNSGSTSETVTYIITPTGPAPSLCPGTPSNFVVTIDPTPDVNNAILSQSFCSGGTASFTPSSSNLGTTFSWSATASSGNVTGFGPAGNGNISDVINNSGNATETVTYVVTPTGPAPSFCVGTPVNFTVSVDPSPSITNLPLTQNICSGTNASITLTSNVTGATFSWTASSSSANLTGFSSNGIGDINEALTNIGSTQETVTYVILPSSPVLACAGTPVNFAVTVDPIPTITNAILTQTICSGLNANFTPTSNVLNTTFSWTASSSSANVTGFSVNGNGNISETLINSGTTTETVTYVISPTGPANSLCSGSSVNFVVTIDPTPTITNISLTQNICSSGNAAFTPTSNINNVTFDWTASSSSANATGFTSIGNGSISDNISNSGSTSETVTYTITPTGPVTSLCVGSSVNFVVTVDPIPVVSNATLTQTICSGGIANLSPNSNVANSTFTWTATASSASVTGFSSSGNGIISETLTNSGTTVETVTYAITPTGPAPSSCPGVFSNFVVTVNPIPAAPTVVSPLSYCPNVAASALTATGSNLLWYTTAAGGVGSPIAPVPSTANSGTFDYYVSQTINGCESPRANIQIIIFSPTASPVVSSPVTYCQNSAVSALSATGNSLLWYTSAAGGVGNAAAPMPSSTTAGTTSYYVTQTLNGCESSRSQIDIIVNALPSAVVSGGGQSCQGSATLPVNITLTGVAPWNITYSDGTSNTSIVAVMSPYTISNPSQGNYTVTTISDANCTGTSNGNATVTINPLPVVAFTPNVNLGCTPLCVQFTDASTVSAGSITGWNWNFGDGTTSNSSVGQHCYSTVANYSVSMTATTAAGCSSNQLYTNLINVVSLPEASFAAPTNISILSPVVNFSDYSAHAISWSWNFGDANDAATNTSNLQNPSHTYSAIGHYCVTLVVSNSANCNDTTEICLDVLPEFSIYIPNAFSPNHDGINDEFFCKGTNIIDFEMYIYDRWGNFVFYADTMDKHWDGTIKGAAVAQEDVYVYMIKVKDNLKENHDYIGNITLVK